MQNVVIVHGCPGSEESLIDMSERTYFKHWIPWARAELEEKGVEVDVPLMPEPWVPNYQMFKREFDTCKVTEDSILVGHSCGCAFLVRWLGDTGRRIKKLILVAPWKIASKGDAGKEEFYGFTINDQVKANVGEIVIFTSDDEVPEGKESVVLYQEALGGRIISLPNHGHYILEDMGTAAFPELVAEVLR